MRGALFGVYTYGTVRVTKKKYIQNNKIPLLVRASLAIQPIVITPFMFPVYIVEDICMLNEDGEQ
jgi:hypothetical protein